MDVWTPLLENSVFQEQIKSKGYFEGPKFSDYLTKYSISNSVKRAGGNTAFHLSIDFYSLQSKQLRDRGLFLLRTGMGKFMIFSEEFFNKSYLDLSVERSSKISFETPSGYSHLIDAYKERLTENASLELMHFLGVFKKIIQDVSSEDEYFIGPRGCRSSKFDVYMRNVRTGENQRMYTYGGQEELDYSLFTEDSIYVIEGKSQSSGGLDIGWHKIAYPLSRFRTFSKDIYPCYILKRRGTIWFFVFPKYIFHNGGIVLNDREAFTPYKVYTIDLRGFSDGS